MKPLGGLTVLAPFRKAVVVALVLGIAAAHSAAVSAEDACARVKQRISRIVRGDRALTRADVGIFIRATDSGRVLYAKNADTPMIPASNFKLVTTAVGLHHLGPDFRFRTEVLGPPPDVGSGIINGNVYLRGNGDPTMVEPWTRPATGPFLTFADRMWERGVRGITGDVVGDDSAFDRDFLGKGWRRHYLLLDYAPETGALSINGNVCHLDVRGDRVNAWPPTSALQYRRVGSRGGPSVSRAFSTNNIIINNVKSNPVRTSMTFHNPPLYTTGTFAAILNDHKIKVDGGARLITAAEAPLPLGLVQYGEHHSAPLLKILKQINKESDNLFAQHVFKAVGWRTGGQGTLDTTTRAINEFLTSLGVDVTNLQVADGCGLSVLNRVTPRQFVELLDGMSRRPDAGVWKSTLSVAGKDGTLSYRMRGLNVVGKTGTIDGTVTLSGYCITKAGQQVSFSILVNHHRTSNDHVRWFQDEIVKVVAACNERL